MPYTVPSIRDQGLQVYLNRKRFNGMTYADFIRVADDTKHPSGKLNAAAIARKFRVSNHTSKGWILVYEEEQASGQASQSTSSERSEVG